MNVWLFGRLIGWSVGRGFCAQALCLAVALTAAGSRGAIGQALTPDVGAWQYLQKQFYGERPIGEVDETFMLIDAPANTPDPAATPVTIRFGPAAVGRIKELRVIIDNNPSPVVATIDFADGARVSSLGLRVRIDRFTSVRAIAETSDGRLEMRSQWVNASGGCSAPPGAVAGGKIGEIRFRSPPGAKSLQVSIRHPNYSGFQIDPASGDPIPPHYVSHIRFSVAGQLLVEADTGISISENPTLRLGSDRPLPAPLQVEFIDSAGAHFSATWPGPAAAAERPAPFAIEEIAPGDFVHLGKMLPLSAVGHDDIANIGFIVGERCVAVIDTGGSTRIGRALRAAIRAATGRPICFVINTHGHVDHVLGNCAFAADRPRFVGHALLPAAIAQSRSFFLSHYAADLDQPATAQQIIAPDLLVERTLDLDLGGRRLHLRAWPAAHTDSDLSVWDMRTETLWTGDLLFRKRLPALDGSATGWIAVIDELAKLHPQRTVPGHGPITQDLGAALAAERRYLAALVDGVRGELKNGQSMRHAIAHVASAERGKWSLWDETHPHNVARVYQQLEWE